MNKQTFNGITFYTSKNLSNLDIIDIAEVSFNPQFNWDLEFSDYPRHERINIGNKKSFIRADTYGFYEGSCKLFGFKYFKEEHHNDVYLYFDPKDLEKVKSYFVDILKMKHFA